MSVDGTNPTSAQPGLSSGFLDALDQDLADADAVLAGRYPGDPGTRQPVHTVYVNADLADPQLMNRWATGAREVLAIAAPDPRAAAALGLPTVDGTVLGQVRAKLDAEPIEDLRLDFEDGYGNRPDEEEDRDATRVASLLPTLLADPAGPLLAGIQVQVVGGADPPPRAAHPGPVRLRPADRWPAARRVPGHPAQGHLRGPGGRDGQDLRGTRAGARPARGGPAVRDPNRDHPGDPGRRRHGRRWPE